MSADGPNVLRGLVDVSHETLDRLKTFERLLRQWQRKTNLVGPETLDRFWSHHLGDAAFLHNYAGSVGNWMDIGAGAGLPGIPLALLADGENTSEQITLVESNAKKCAFQRAAILETGLRDGGVEVRIYNRRIKDVDAVPGTVLTARALAPLSDLLTYAGDLRVSRGIFFKGERHEEEINVARTRHQFDLTIVPHPLRHGSVLLDVRL